MTRTRAVLLDAGHTLLYAHPDLGTVYAETTADLGLRLAPETFVAAFGPAFRQHVKVYQASGHASDEQDYLMWRAITRGVWEGIPELRTIGFDAWFEALYRRFGEAGTWRLYDDVLDVLRELRSRGLRLGVVSNWDSRLQGISDGLGLSPAVDAVVISAVAGVRKPDPGIFRVALDALGVRPEEAVHVGDLPEEDVAGALAAGVRPVLIRRSKKMLASEGPPGVPVIEDLRGLASLV